MIQVLQSEGLVRENFYLPTVFEVVPAEVCVDKKEASELLQFYKEKNGFTRIISEYMINVRQRMR